MPYVAPKLTKNFFNFQNQVFFSVFMFYFPDNFSTASGNCPRAISLILPPTLLLAIFFFCKTKNVYYSFSLLSGRRCSSSRTSSFSFGACTFFVGSCKVNISWKMCSGSSFLMCQKGSTVW